MKTIRETIQTDFTDRGSKFINFLFPVSEEVEIQQFLQQLKERYADASHHCYAWRIDPEQLREYANDDGEPGGTAGLPILNALKSADLLDVFCVVVRYFGGTKLGKPGLINAYRTGAELCIEKATITELVKIAELKISFPYSEQKHIDQLLHHQQAHIISSDYGTEVTTICSVLFEQKTEISSILDSLEHKGIVYELLKSGYGTTAK